jgi:hypothetical protein
MLAITPLRATLLSLLVVYPTITLSCLPLRLYGLLDGARTFASTLCYHSYISSDIGYYAATALFAALLVFALLGLRRCPSFVRACLIRVGCRSKGRRGLDAGKHRVYVVSRCASRAPVLIPVPHSICALARRAKALQSIVAAKAGCATLAVTFALRVPSSYLTAFMHICVSYALAPWDALHAFKSRDLWYCPALSKPFASMEAAVTLVQDYCWCAWLRASYCI